MKYNTDCKQFTNNGITVKIGEIIDIGTMDTLVNNYISEQYGIDDNKHSENTFSISSTIYNKDYDIVKQIDVGVELLENYTIENIKELNDNDLDLFYKVPCKVIFLNRI